MNFYSVKIGQRTRRGNLIENVSFVCKTFNDSAVDVQSHWQNQYLGFDVAVDVVKDIKETDVKKSFSFGSEEREEVRGYKKEINELKQKLKPNKIFNYKSKLGKSDYPDDLISVVSEIKAAKSAIYKLEVKAEELANNHLKAANKGKIHWARIDEGFDSVYDTYSYEVRLMGTLIEHTQDED